MCSSSVGLCSETVAVILQTAKVRTEDTPDESLENVRIEDSPDETVVNNAPTSIGLDQTLPEHGTVDRKGSDVRVVMSSTIPLEIECCSENIRQMSSASNSKLATSAPEDNNTGMDHADPHEHSGYF